MKNTKKINNVHPFAFLNINLEKSYKGKYVLKNARGVSERFVSKLCVFLPVTPYPLNFLLFQENGPTLFLSYFYYRLSTKIFLRQASDHPLAKKVQENHFNYITWLTILSIFFP